MISALHINTSRLHALSRVLFLCIALVSAACAIGEISYQYEDEPVTSGLIQTAENLQQLGVLANKRSLPVMLEFSTSWCEYCEALEQQVLEPMLRGGEYADKIIIRKLVVDEFYSVIDFAGKNISTTQLAMDKQVDLYPTLLFIDGDGRQLSDSVIGVTVLEFIPQKIDRAIQQSRLRLQQRNRNND